MNHRSMASICVRFAAVAGAAAALLGCPNPQTYGTPRTTPSGKIQHTVAVEGLHASSTTEIPATGTTPAREQSNSVTVPMFPTYQLRVGVADRVDVGARITNLSALGADVKWNFMKSEGIDLAIDPGVQMNYFSVNSNSIFILYGHLPLLAGFNFGESTTLILSGGLVAAYASASTTDADRSATSAASGGSVGARFGLGMQFRLGKKFAIHPEVTGMRFFSDAGNLMIVFGLGFNFGNLPSYAKGSENDPGDEPEEKKPADPAAAPAPGAAPAPAPGATPAPAGGT